MPRRQRRGWVPQPTKSQYAKYYPLAKKVMTIAAQKAQPIVSNYIKGKIGPWTTSGSKKKKTIKEDQSITSSSGKTYSKQGKRVIKPPAYLKQFQEMFNYSNERGFLKWTSGVQDYFVPSFVLDSVDLSDWYGSTGGTNDFSLGVNNNNKINLYIKGVTGNIMLKNHANVQAKIIMYECKVKRTTDMNPLTAIRDGIAARYNETPATSTKYKLINHAPNLSGEFNSKFSILSAKEIIMDPGQVHEHKFVYNYNRSFCVSDYYSDLKNGNEPWIGGWTRFTMFKCQGTPDTTTDGLTVSTSSGKIIWTYDQRVTYLLTNTLKEKSYATGSIGSIATEQTIVEDTDTSAAVVTL